LVQPTVDCGAFLTPDTCIEPCRYVPAKRSCERPAGLVYWQNSVFASSYYIGAVMGPLVVAHALHRLWYRSTIALCGATLIVSLGVHHLGRAVDEFWVIVVGRAFYGCGAVGLRFASSLFAFHTVARDLHTGLATSLTQPAIEFGVLVSGLYTYFAYPADMSHHLHVETKIHAQMCMAHAVGLAAIVFAVWVIREPAAQPGREPPPDGVGSAGAMRGTTSTTTAPPPTTKRGRFAAGSGAVPLPPGGLVLPMFRHPKHLAIGATVCFAMCLTGLGPTAAYAPLYSVQAAGVHHALAGLLISCVAFPAAASSIGVRLWLRFPRPLIITGTGGIAVMCALLGFATMPGIISSGSARHGLTLAAVAGFFVALDAFVAPTFYELALSTQHRSVRSSAGAFLNSFVTLTSMVDTILYPIAVNGLSGGEGGNQLRGYAIVSFFHGTVAVACALVMWRWLRPNRPNLDKGDSNEGSPQHDDAETHAQDAEFSPRPEDDSGATHPV
jgi:hypothetical protein